MLSRSFNNFYFECYCWMNNDSLEVSSLTICTTKENTTKH